MVTMVSGIMDTMGTHIMDTGEEKGDQQSLRQKQQLRPRLIPGCCMEAIMDILMVDITTLENKLFHQQNIKEMPKSIIKF